jgi:hypothetical protein
MTAALFHRTAFDRVGSPAHRTACAVRLIDRRTGQTHRINGSPLVLFTKAPEEAAAELLEGRDAAVWEARIEPIETGNQP